MAKIALLLFFFLFNGCSFKSLYLGDEVDKVQVVGQSAYVKHHRAYFTRTHLRIIRDGKKHLYMYNPKTHEVAVLLHKNNQFLLYNMSKPGQNPFVINAKRTTKYWQVLKPIRRKGFKIVRSLASLGITASDSRQIYKGVKTLLIQIKDYSRLQSRYERAIKNYDASTIRSIRTKLPKNLIAGYYTRYAKRAKTRAQLLALRTIALKVGIKPPKIPGIKPTHTEIQNTEPTREEKQDNNEENIKSVEKENQEKPQQAAADKEAKDTVEKVPEVKKVLPRKVPTEKSYHYYLKRASLTELSAYLSKKATRRSLSYTRYWKLMRQKQALEEEKLLKEGDLEALIAAYKVNKDPKYKARIMILIKEKQDQNKEVN